MNWNDIKICAYEQLVRRQLADPIYKTRLDFEIAEIEKQGATTWWVNSKAATEKKWDNSAGLLMPYLVGMADADPISARKGDVPTSTHYKYVGDWVKRTGKLPADIYRDSDAPDIDVDCLPSARDPIKAYAIKKYGGDMADGIGRVCSVGTYQAYKFKSALADSAVGLGTCQKELVLKLTDILPEEVDGLQENGESSCVGKIKNATTGEEKECGKKHSGIKCPKCGCPDTEDPTIGQMLQNYPELLAFTQEYPEVVGESLKLIGKLRHMGKHAGALIIADRPLYGNVPMYKKDGHWVSMWTEGRNPQLSKFGYTKWDILGLKNLAYIFECCKMIEENHGLDFGHALSGLADINPKEGRAGSYILNGERVAIPLNDPKALQIANDRKTDAIFQFDTELAKRILSNGVKTFYDLMILNALGHPGPMACIPEYIARRDDPDATWRVIDDPRITAILGETMNVIVYQEQLANMWMILGGFTAPEAQAARKAVAKKWRDKLKPIEGKWIEGATPVMGREKAIEWWAKMVDFGRYAFNKSHSAAYCLTAYLNLWLKAYYRPEYWSTVLSYCDDPKKFVRYMNVARSEKVAFGPLDIRNLKVDFHAKDDIVSPGLIGIKGIGDKAAAEFQGTWTGTDIDSFVLSKPKNKSVLERLVKLGGFTKLPGHECIKATWLWYMFKYCAGTDITKLKALVRRKLADQERWTEEKIEAERERQAAEYKKTYPKRNKIPDKILKWVPKPKEDRASVMSLIENEFSVEELLEFEKTYLGYYIHSPLDIFMHTGGLTISNAKEESLAEGVAIFEGVITTAGISKTKTDKTMCRLIISDGIEETLLILWEDNIRTHAIENFREGTGVQACVRYDEKRNSFTLARNTVMMRLERKNIPLLSIMSELEAR